MPAETQTYEPAEQSDSLLEGAPRATWSLPKRGLLGALVLLATAGALLLWTNGRGRVTRVSAGGVVGLQAADDPCSAYPFIALESVLHSNLGNQGPDTGDEGIVFQAKDYIPGQAPIDLLMIVNASSAYRAGHARFNGIHGKYGLITLKAGNEAEFTIKIVNPATGQLVVLQKQEFTFFDLDQSAAGNNQEYIIVQGAEQIWLTQHTEIEVSEMPSGAQRFISSQPGSGSDNPKDPLALTVQQKNRAVTIQFKDFNELKVTLGCTAGKYARYFMFVARPSLLCAQTVGQVEDGEDKVVNVETTSPPPVDNGRSGVTGTTAPSARECLVTIPIINLCVPKFW